MRKILLIIIMILLLALGFVSLKNGIKIGNIEILSIEQIEAKSQDLNTKIEEVNSLIDVDYPKKRSELNTEQEHLSTAQEEYYKYMNLSSDAEILEAMEKKSYTIEFLWTTLGTHAREQEILLTFELVSNSAGISGMNDIKFNVNGSYIAITNFIYAIENDSSLNFRIQDFKLLPYQGDILQGTFTVKNVTVEGNTSTQNVTSTSTSTQTTEPTSTEPVSTEQDNQKQTTEQ